MNIFFQVFYCLKFLRIFFIDIFGVEAVDIGAVKKIKIGHDGNKPGAGWFLDKGTPEKHPTQKKILKFLSSYCQE